MTPNAINLYYLVRLIRNFPGLHVLPLKDGAILTSNEKVRQRACRDVFDPTLSSKDCGALGPTIQSSIASHSLQLRSAA